ncbi:sporulation protein [Caldifermentibacillus hisashii]|uniref:sporulation protein n=1 Tax=Bacillaceae TaxID=186817 RepID=UPI000D557D8D|nr:MULTISPECIES: sporulation protein [Bacillaceae]AWI11889.1 sporulation protein [Caldibacillus thermoamylovorans]MDL0420065.1 sporulation protein [Caldibacillus thermoamylovorans]MED3644182.1 sporulation protein [Caldifermentibacillus hisashii]
MEKRLMLFIFSLSVLLFGCSTVNDTPETRSSLVRTSNPNPIAVNNKDEKLVGDIKKTALSIDGIYDVAVIKGEAKDCLVAFKVHHLERFRMKKIEKQLTKELQKQFKDLSFTVSSDFKIFLEAVRLNEKVERENLSKEKKEKRLQEIIKLSREKT